MQGTQRFSSSTALGPEDRVAVYAFDKDLYRLTDFTKTKEDAIDALTRLSPFGSTALYDAVVTLSDYVVHEGFGRRAIVVLTDGIDTSSEATIEQAVERAKGVDLPVYAIRVLSPVDDPESDLFLGVHGASFRGEDALRRFTAETGGALYAGSQWGQLVVASARIREELKTQYRIGYVIGGEHLPDRDFLLSDARRRARGRRRRGRRRGGGGGCRSTTRLFLRFPLLGFSIFASSRFEIRRRRSGSRARLLTNRRSLQDVSRWPLPTSRVDKTAAP